MWWSWTSTGICVQGWKHFLARGDQTYEAVFHGLSGFCCSLHYKVLQKTSKIFWLFFFFFFNVKEPFLVVLAGSVRAGWRSTFPMVSLAHGTEGCKKYVGVDAGGWREDFAFLCFSSNIINCCLAGRPLDLYPCASLQILWFWNKVGENPVCPVMRSAD